MSRYTVYVAAGACKEIKSLPGNVRQRVKHAIDDLESGAQAAKSKKLDTSELDRDVYRLRLDN